MDIRQPLTPAFLNTMTDRIRRARTSPQKTKAAQAIQYDMLLYHQPDVHSPLEQYLVLTLGDAKEATSVVPKTLNPQWNQSFDLPITGIESLLLEVQCWDKDRFGKDYMGEVDIALEDIFREGQTSDEVREA